MLHTLTIQEARKGLDNRTFSSVELTQACLGRITERNDEINAFITVTKELALEEAKYADGQIAKGKATQLTGIPFGVKDAICVKGIRSTGGATILDNYIPPHEATVITKIRQQGAVLLGKQNCDSFGHGASNENSMYGSVKNPKNTTKVPGGSSGGSAAAVADNQCIFSIAEDTGGSIRQPAGMCGVVGMRPSYGRNSRYGCMPLASSLDTIGPITKTVEDAAIIMEIIAGKDERDATTVADPVPDYTEACQKDISGLTIGIPKEYFTLGGVDPEITEAIARYVTQLEKKGCTIKEVSLPHTKYAVAVYYIVVPSEDSANLARLDGIRYGMQAKAETVYDTYSKSRSQGFPEEVKRRIMIGTYALSAGYFDAYYKKAQKVRTCIRQDFTNAFSSVDALITPTSPFAAFGLGQKTADPLRMYLADVMVSPASLAGVPAISIPAGNTSEGLPIGLQVIGPRLGESTVLQIGNSLFTQ
ncbi:MAG: Asp-tRNA(Asn)/Glu-tRNA(Gln) amidotransferase GatCAB subunit A [Candidatus Magasanikbacteria bacterium]|nr:Asp-tRNA(Asn)/Glu-tRNA(Gln) amidotransferase GatCAB subunit A [Candidatus Magasanikbacteria bacterium]